MKFIILRLLTHSELGMFHAYRDGREGSRQRAINFDGAVVDRVFPSAKDSDRVMINCRCLDDATSVVAKQQWLKRQEKNWRLEGNCPTSEYYRFVEPGVLFAMMVDASTTPADASWIVIPTGSPAYRKIVEHGESSGLGRAAMIALYGNEGDHTMRVLGEHFPQLFPRPEPQTTPEGEGGDEPDPGGLFDILASAGYRLPSAIADLVDNSISAGATEIDIHFPNPNDGGRWMCVRDNGKGMTSTELRHAMRVGSRRSYGGNDLGKFGYGLKGASWSQADCLTVVSKAEKDSEPSIRIWDKDHLVKSGRWETLSTPIEAKFAAQTEIPETGTAVLLTKMRPPSEIHTVRDVDPYTVEVTELRHHLELVFHRFLNGVAKGREQLTIRINGTPLVANDPMGHPLCKSHDPRTITINPDDPEAKAVLTVRATITPNEDEIERYHAGEGPEAQRDARERISLYGRWNETQGLYFYRLDRLIKWGGWEGIFAVDEKTKLLRVAVDFDRRADGPLQVNISKQEIRLPVTVSDRIKDIVKEPRAEARTRYRKPGKKAALPPSRPLAPTPTAPPSPPAGSDGTPPPPPFGGSKPKAPKSIANPIRIVDSGSAPWERKIGFTGETVEVTPCIPELVELVRIIDSDTQAKLALSQFLLALEKAGVLRKFGDA
ncbi:MAG: ATP-binding protein [Betaproteobacteria bacterium]|nr:ATP-binding protein [Betaproteobacteria bacterium]MDE2151777.1 ATP-binding protein [Betaproteobacteria bacterium]